MYEREIDRHRKRDSNKHDERAASDGGDVTASIMPDNPAAAAAASAPHRSR